MKKVVAKTYSVERIADVYLATLSANEFKNEGPLLPDVLREQGIFFDEEIIAGTVQLLEDRKYISAVGDAGTYTVFKPANDKREVIIQSSLAHSNVNSLRPKNVDFSSSLKYYKITAAGARFVRLGQVLDVQGKVEREAERKKWKERLINAIIALTLSVLAIAAKSCVFDKIVPIQKTVSENAPKNLRF